MTKYLVKNYVSIRKDPNPGSLRYEEFIDYVPGDIADSKDLPPHTDIDYLLAGNHIEEIPEAKKPKEVEVVDESVAEVTEND